MSSYILDDVIENKWLYLLSCLQNEMMSHLACFSSPLQEDFLWGERQTGGGGAVKGPDRDRRRTQQHHTNKHRCQQGVMEPGDNGPNSALFCSSSAEGETVQELWFPVPLNTPFKQHSDWFQCALTTPFSWYTFTVSPKVSRLGHERFILFFYRYFI